MSSDKKSKHRSIVLPTNRVPFSKDGKNYIIGIAIDQYQHCTPLENAVRDTIEVIKVLIDRYQFRNEEVYLLFNEKATRANVIRLFEQMVAKVKPTDNLIIYFAGHGHLNPNTKRGAWFTVESRPDDPSSHLKNSTIVDYIKDISSRHTFLVSDSCFSGKLFAKHRAIEESKHYDKIYRIPSRWGFTSGAEELVSDGTQGGNSPFAQALIECLYSNNNPFLSVWELIDYVQKYVGINHNQQPIGNRLYGVDDRGQGQFVFFLKEGVSPANTSKLVENHSFQMDFPSTHATAIQKIRMSWRKVLQLGLIVVLVALAIIMTSKFNRSNQSKKLGSFPILSTDSTATDNASLSGPEEEPDLLKGTPELLNNSIAERDRSNPVGSNKRSDVAEEKEENGQSSDGEKPTFESTLNSPEESEITPPRIEKNIDFISLPGGSFTMGSAEGKSNNQPPHAVQLSRFKIARSEVTLQDYANFLNARQIPKDEALSLIRLGAVNLSIDKDTRLYQIKPGYEQHPAGGLSWEGARAYCEWVGGRLPREAEWEFAARAGAGTGNFLYSGGNNPNEIGWFQDNSNGPRRVKSKKPNALGIYDMSGNVAEWCADYYDSDYYRSSPNVDPTGPSSNKPVRVVRGGSYDSHKIYLQTWYREYRTPDTRDPRIGCRCVWDR